MTKSASYWYSRLFAVKNSSGHLPWGFEWRSSKWFTVLMVSVALWTDLFLYGLVVPILPFLLEDRLHVPSHSVQSYGSGLLAAYAASSMVFSAPTGYVADRISTRRAPFLLGLLALFASTLLLFLGKSLPVLFAARMLQGVSSAFVWTIGLVLCVETVGTEKLGQTMGSIFGSISVGSLFAPPLGGILYEKAGLKGVFGLSSAVLAIDFVLRILVIDSHTRDSYKAAQQDSNGRNGAPASQSHHAEERQEATETTALLAGPDTGELEYKISSDLPRICHKMSILPCLADSRLLIAMFLTFVQAVLLGSYDATIPTVAREYYGLTPLKASLLFLPLGVCNLVLGPVFGWCVDRYGTKPVAVIGYVYLPIALCLLNLPQPGGLSNILVYAGVLALNGIGLAAIDSPPVVEAAKVVDRYYDSNREFFGNKKPYAQLYGVNNIFFNLGLTVGPELAGELKQHIGYGKMSLVLAGICAVSALGSWWFIDPRSIERAERSRSGSESG